MAINIKSEDTERLARELAAATGESLTRAVQVALVERLARVRSASESDRTTRAERILAIGRDAAGRWQEPARSTEHGDLLYDELGLPR